VSEKHVGQPLTPIREVTMLDAVVISLVRRRAHVRRSMIHGQYIAMQKGQLRPICPSMAIAVAGIAPGFAPTPPGIIATGHVKHATFQLDQAAVTLAYQPKGGFGGRGFNTRRHRSGVSKAVTTGQIRSCS
jgi:hypothetical protein